MNGIVYFVHSGKTFTLIFRARGMNNIASDYFMYGTIMIAFPRISEGTVDVAQCRYVIYCLEITSRERDAHKFPLTLGDRGRIH